MQHTHQTSLQVFDPQRLPWVVDGLGSFRNNRVDVLSGRQVSLFADTQEGHPGRQRCPRIFCRHHIPIDIVIAAKKAFAAVA